MMNHAPKHEPTPLPEQIVAALSGIIQRTRRLVILRGVCASCATGIGAFLLIMLLDASVTLLEPWPRWLMTILAYAVWAAATIWFLIRPLTHSFTLAGVARLIETHHPELQERISSAVELLNSRDLPSIRGSETLIAALTAEAVSEAVTLQPRQEISFRSAIPFVVAMGVVLIALAALCLVQPRQAGFLLARATAPFLNLPNVHAIDLMVEPGDTLVAAGSSLQVSLRTVNPAVTSAQLRQMNRQGRETVTAMIQLPALTNQPGRRFAATIPSVASEFRYRVHAGDALSKYFTVNVAIPPVIEHLDITYRYPAYTRLEEKHEHDWSGTIRAIAGTDVSLSAQVNKPVSQASLFINTSVITNTFKGTLRMEGKTVFYDFKLSLPKGLKGDWTLRLSDEINLLNKPFEHLIQTIPDTRPVVTVTSPTLKELRLNRDTRLPVTYHAEDDYGLTAAALVLTFPGLTNDLIRSLPLPATQSEFAPRLITSEIPIVLADPVFTNAPRVSVRIRAYDTLPGSACGPQFSDSEPFTILFDKQADSWIEQVLDSQDQRVQKGLKQVQQKLVAAREQKLALEKNLSQKPIPESTARQIDTLQDTLASADNELRKLATDIDKGFYENLSSNLTALAENHVSKAENQAGQLRLVDTPAERSAITSNITAEISTSLEAVENAMKEHAIAQAAVHRAVELEQLADKQAALARALQEMEQAPSIPVSNATALAQAASASNEWSRAQDQVADELAKVARENPGSMAQIANTLSNLTTQAAAQATELADHQNELAKLTQAESDRLKKLNNQWHELASRQNQLAELARAEPLAAGQNESMRNAAKDLDAGKQEQALKTQADVSEALRQAAGQKREEALSQTTTDRPDPARELAARAAELKAGQQTTDSAKSEDPLAKAATLQAARQAQEASQLAQQAAQNAGQSAEQARQKAQQAEQQADTAKQTALKTAQAAEQATQQVAESKGKANEQELSRNAEAARKIAQAAQKNETASNVAAQEVKQVAQSVAQQAEKAGQAAQSAAQAAQQATEQAEKATLMTSSNAVRQAQSETFKAATTASTEARNAAEAALKASELALSASDIKARQQAAIDPKSGDASGKTAAQNEAQQAQESEQLARQAVQNAEKATENTRQAVQQLEQQEFLAKKAVEQSKEAVEQAASQAQRSMGKANEQELIRAAQTARENAAMAQHTADVAHENTQQAQQLAKAAEQQVQEAQKATKATRQAAQQATEQAQRSDSATSPQAAEKAQAATTQAAAEAIDHAVEAQEAALKAGQYAARATDLTTAQQSSGKPDREPASTQADTQRAAQQANEAAQQARQAAVNAEQAAENTRQATRQMEQQASLAKDVAPKTEKAAQQAVQQAQRFQQAAENRAGKAQTAAQAAQQAAQQATEQAEKAATTTSPQATEKAQAETAKAAASATANALAAEEASLKASELAARTADLKAKQQAAGLINLETTATKAAAQQAARQAQDASKIARQATQYADQAAERARQTAQNNDRQSPAAQQAAARNAQATEQQVQKAQQAAQAAKQAAQQAAEQAGKTATATSPRAAEQAQAETARAAATATAQAVTAQEAALKANELSAQQANPAAPAAATASPKSVTPASGNASPASSAKKAAAQQAAKQAQEAGNIAQQAAQNAAQAAESARQAARPNDQQAAEQQVQKARQAAQVARQAAQQATEYAAKAAAATTPHAIEQAQADTTKAAATATAQASVAAEAALEVSDMAARTRHQSEALKLAELARQQEELHREGARMMTENQGARDTLQATLSRQVAGQQRKLADDTEALAQELNREPPTTRTDAQASRAAESARQAAQAMQNREMPQASSASTEARQAMAQLADTLQVAALATPQYRLDKRAELAHLANRADTLAKQQEQLGEQMGALAENRPHEALQLQQEQVSGEVKDLARAAQVLHAQADDVLPQSQIAPKTAEATRELAQASQSANQSAQQMQKATGEADESGRTPSAQEQQQAASQTLQSQRSAAQSLKQAASQLQQGATATAAAQPAPAASDQLPSASPAAQQALAQASQSARQAAENAQADAASQAASQLAQAAQAAAIDAQSKGANPSPSALQSASSGNSGDGSDKPQATDGAPSFARRMGMKLQDWLKLHGELKDDVLQSANNEGPEEYRPIIQKYFHEVSGHGEEE